MSTRKILSSRLFPLVLLAAACSSSSSAPALPSLTLSVSPATLTIAAGETATLEVTAVRADAAPIALVVQGVPDGVRVDSPAIGAGEAVAVVSFRNQCTGNAVEGAPVTVRGSSGGNSAAASFSMSVQCAATGEPGLRASPATATRST